jgi:hypothetical protein
MRERDLSDSSVERKLLLTRILATKIVDFCVKFFHMMRGVRIECVFFFYLESF